jgi:protein MpaA
MRPRAASGVVGRRRLALVLLAALPTGVVAATGAVAPASGTRHVTLGRSVRGEQIDAIELRGAHPTRAALVIGCIHGDEPAGIAVADALARGPAPAGVDLWIVRDLNPDGVASHTRGNAHGVDLNRNFPYRWRPLGPPGTQQYAGPRALSEPESRLARALIRRVHPRLTIWFHQPLAVTDESGGDLRVERRFAARSGLPLRRLARYPGSATTWQDHRFRGTTAFVVELPPGRPSARAIARYVGAVWAVVSPRRARKR